MKKLLTSILTIALVFSVSTSINAEGETPTPEPEETTITTVNETETKTLPEVLEKGEYGSNYYIKQSAKVVLDKNYEYHTSIVVTNSAKVTIDLNGYSLNVESLVCDGNGTELTIIDSKTNSKPIVSGYDVEYTSGKIKGLVSVSNNGTFYLESGTISGALEVFGNVLSSKEEDAIHSSAIINGGYINNNEEIGLGETSTAVVIGNGAFLQINDGVLKAKNKAVISGNGDSEIWGGTTIKINGGKFMVIQ